MNCRKLFIFLIILLFSAPVSAEFYKYYDENGNIHFTDDYNKVPLNQRQNVKGYEEVRSDESDLATTEKEGEAQSEEESDESQTATKGNKFDFDVKIKEFDRRKQDLALEYESLMKENQKLANEKANAKTAAEIRKYNERVSALNKKINEHDRKRKEFFTEVEAYNAKVNEENERRKQKQGKKKQK